MGKTSLEEVWGGKKLVVQVLEGKGLASKDSNGLSDPYVKLFLGKQQIKTNTYKKTLNPQFSEKEIFFFEDDGTSDFILEVWDYDRISSDDFMGMVHFGKPSQAFKSEHVVDEWFTLKGRSGKKDVVSGSIRCKIYWSPHPEIRPIVRDTNVFFYGLYEKNFKTGDLIVYDGIGLLDTLQKVTSGARYSRVGMIVKMPNKWTGKIETYLLEYTRNLDRFLDVYKETPGYGVCLFRWDERVHQIHANSVYYSALKSPLSKEDENKIIEWVQQIHGGRSAFYKVQTVQLHPTVSHLLEEIDKSLLKSDLNELYSAEMVIESLRAGGQNPLRERTQAGKAYSPNDLLLSGWYEPPLLIRCRDSEVASRTDIPKQPEPQPQQQQQQQAPPPYTPPDALNQYNSGLPLMPPQQQQFIVAQGGFPPNQPVFVQVPGYNTVRGPVFMAADQMMVPGYVQGPPPSQYGIPPQQLQGVPPSAYPDQPHQSNSLGGIPPPS